MHQGKPYHPRSTKALRKGSTSPRFSFLKVRDLTSSGHVGCSGVNGEGRVSADGDSSYLAQSPLPE